MLRGSNRMVLVLVNQHSLRGLVSADKFGAAVAAAQWDRELYAYSVHCVPRCVDSHTKGALPQSRAICRSLPLMRLPGAQLPELYHQTLLFLGCLR